jgi:Xaa-Pro aminopeptidase
VWVQREELARLLKKLIDGRTVAAEYSPGGAIPYADYVPAGVVEFLRESGAHVVSSTELVSRVLSVWSEAGLASHTRAAEAIARIGRDAITLAGERARTDPISEAELARWIMRAFQKEALVTESSPSVCWGPNAARNHYDPSIGDSDPIKPGALLLVDLWAKEPGGIFADLTFMGSIGEPNDEASHIWTVVRDARDAALDRLRETIRAGARPTGAEIDRAARQVIDQAGLLQYTQCRTGHSIDQHGLHGYGPTIDDTESYDHRSIIPGVAFSVEPGVYIPGRIGVRTEVNVHAGEDDIVVTPAEVQRELWVV